MLLWCNTVNAPLAHIVIAVAATAHSAFRVQQTHGVGSRPANNIDIARIMGFSEFWDSKWSLIVAYVHSPIVLGC